MSSVYIDANHGLAQVAAPLLKRCVLFCKDYGANDVRAIAYGDNLPYIQLLFNCGFRTYSTRALMHRGLPPRRGANISPLAAEKG